MSEQLWDFLSACAAVNDAAQDAGHPPFMASLGRETPLDSSPYVYDVQRFAEAFGGTLRRRRLLAGLLARIAMLERAGIRIDLLLVGGSFLKPECEPADIDALGIYTLTCQAEAGASALAQAAPRNRAEDLHLCPADAHPAILLKRAIYFSNLFAYSKQSGALERGIVMVVPRHTAPHRAAA